MNYQQQLAKEHGLKSGRELTRLSATRPDGTKWTRLYLYDTAAFIEMDMGGVKNWPDFKRERVQWDGAEEVSFYNGD